MSDDQKRHPKGAPASVGGRWAADDQRQGSTIDAEPGRVVAIFTPDVPMTRPRGGLLYGRLVVERTPGQGELRVDGHVDAWEVEELLGVDDATDDGAEELDAFIADDGDAFLDWLDTRHDDVAVDHDERWPFVGATASVRLQGELTEDGAIAALLGSDAHETLDRLAQQRGGLIERYRRWEATGQSTLDADEVDRFVADYLNTALWSSVYLSDDGSSESLDGFSIDDVDATSRENLRAEAASFLDANLLDVERALDRDGYDASQLAHDLWLTRNGHGAGFWDRGLGDLGDRLTAASKAYGGIDLYVGDDGKVHAAGYEQDSAA